MYDIDKYGKITFTTKGKGSDIYRLVNEELNELGRAIKEINNNGGDNMKGRPAIEITDLYLKAYLAVKFDEPLDIKKNHVNGRETVTWIYPDDEEVRELIEEYKEDKFMSRYIAEYLRAKREITETLRG